MTGGELIYTDGADRLMESRCHRVARTSDSGLTLSLRHLNGVYTQAFSHRHGLVGHLVQGRFKAILVGSEA